VKVPVSAKKRAAKKKGSASAVEAKGLIRKITIPIAVQPRIAVNAIPER
jgi:hypothetical protein